MHVTTCSSSQKLLEHASSSSVETCLFLLSESEACLFFLLRSPKRIADEAELVSGFTEEDCPSCFACVLPTFAVLDEDEEEEKEMSGFSVETFGCLVEEEKE